MSNEKHSGSTKSKYDPKRPIRLVQIVEHIEDETHFFDIEYTHLTGELRRVKISRSQGAGVVQNTLLDAGARLPPDPKKAIATALTAQVPMVAVTKRTGWHGDCFVLPDRTIGDHPQKLAYWDKRGSEPAATAAGTIKAWKKALRKACAGSSYLTFAMALGFAGPLIGRLQRRDGFFFNLAGESSTGKTLATRAGRSVIGRADSTGIHTPSMKDRAIEELAFAHNDTTMFIDDLGLLKGPQSKKHETLSRYAYELASGNGMRRSKVVSSELPNLSWAIVGLTSWEHPLKELRAQGEQVRLIDVPVPVRSKGGVFDLVRGAEGPGLRKRLARLVQTTVDANYGHAFPTFLEHLIAGGQPLIDDLNEIVDNFMRDVRKEGNPLLDRFAEKFGIVLAAALLAADADVAPWTKLQATEAVRRVYFDASTKLVTAEDAAKDFLRQLGKRAADKTQFPWVQPKGAFPGKLKDTAFGFRTALPKVGKVVAIRRSKFMEMAGSPARQAAIMPVLAEQGSLIKGSGNKSTMQMRIKGLSQKRLRYYVLRADSLPSMGGQD